MRGRDKFEKYKKIINLLVHIVKLLVPTKLRMSSLSLFRMCPGNIGFVIRYVLLKTLANKCGDNIAIYPNVYLLNVDNLTIGDNVSIHPFSYIESLGEVYIGNDVSIAHGCTIMSTNHNYGKSNIPIKDQGIKLSSVVIEDNVWLGAKSSILAGTRVKAGVVVATGAVVTKDFPRDSIIGGVPAKFIKGRVQ